MATFAVMSADAMTEETRSSRSDVGVALRTVPFGGLVIAIGMAMLLGLTLPSSSPPSEDAAASTALVMWIAAVAALAASACSTGLRPPIRRSVLLVCLLTEAVLGWVVARRLEGAWVDACDFGGSGDRCIASDGSAPAWVTIAWPVAGALIAACCVLVAATGRRPSD